MARRSISRSTDEPAQPTGRRLVVGVIRGAHGVRGEVRVAPDTDNPRRFAAGAVLEVDGLGERRVLKRRGSEASPILTLEGIADRGAAEALRGRTLSVAIEDARAATSGHLWADLVGLRVEDEHGRALGVLAEVLRPGGDVDVFRVRRPDGGELLVPAIESVVLRIDRTSGRMVVRPQEEA